MSISTTTVTIVSSNVGLSFKVILWVRSFWLRVQIVGVYSLILEDGYYRARLREVQRFSFFHIWEALIQSVFWLNKISKLVVFVGVWSSVLVDEPA